MRPNYLMSAWQLVYHVLWARLWRSMLVMLRLLEGEVKIWHLPYLLPHLSIHTLLNLQVHYFTIIGLSSLTLFSIIKLITLKPFA